MSIICRDCGFENEDGERFCAMCNADLSAVAQTVSPAAPKIKPPLTEKLNENEAMTIAQIKTVTQTEKPMQSNTAAGAKKFFVYCENSRTKTPVDGASITSYYCAGCKEVHQIDDFFWSVQEEVSVQQPAVKEPTAERENSGSGQHLILEDLDTHVQIEISMAGGTLGRYGTYGADYLQRDPRGRMVSGEHCRFKYEYGRWYIEHLSRTNDTVYNGRKLEHGYEEAIRDGKIITLANAISFLIRIF